MSLIFKDRIKETTTTTGTGALTLLGAVTNFRSFADVGNNNVCYYCIEDTTNNVWEVGAGTYTASGTTLTRTTVFNNSSGTSSALNLSAGTKNVYLSAIAGSYLSETAIKSAAYTVVPGETVLVSPNAAAGNFAITFPASPYNGCHFAALVVAEHATRKVTFNLNGGSFVGAIGEYDLLSNGEYVKFKYNSDLAKWYLDYDGRIACRAKLQRTTTQSISGTTFTKVDLNSEVFDFGNIADPTTNYRITIRRPGRYRVNGFHAFATTASAVTYLLTDIYYNGTRTYTYGVGNSVGSPTLTDALTPISREIVCSVDDYFELGVFHTYSSALNTTTSVIGRPELFVEELLQ